MAIEKSSNCVSNYLIIALTLVSTRKARGSCFHPVSFFKAFFCFLLIFTINPPAAPPQ